MDNASLAEERLIEVVGLFSITTVPAIFYTLVFILYCLSVRLSYAQLRDDNGKIRRQTMWTFLLQTVLFMLATSDIIINNRHAQIAYIDYNIVTGGPISPSAIRSVSTLLKLDRLVDVAEAFLILSVLLWRVWVIWSGTRYSTIFTIVCAFFHFASSGVEIAYCVITWNVADLNQLAIPQVGAIVYVVAIAVCLANLVFMASVIIARLVYIRQKHVKLMGKSDVASQYVGIAAMLIESYALDTLWNTGTIISFSLKYTPATNLFFIATTQVDVLTEFLLIYRVLSGRAWTRQTQDRLSTLRWASSEAGTTASGRDDLWQSSVLEEEPP